MWMWNTVSPHGAIAGMTGPKLRAGAGAGARPTLSHPATACSERCYDLFHLLCESFGAFNRRCLGIDADDRLCI